MLDVPGYSSQQELHRGRKCVVVRAIRDRDGLSVILKAPAEEFPKPEEIASLRREFEILTGLDAPGVARALGIEVVRDRPVLVLEDRGGAALKERLAAGPLDLSAFFDVAIPLAEAVGELHGRGIIHKDLNPKNILLDAARGRVTLLDFGISSRAASEEQAPHQPHLLEGTIAYMSPEQTGRMNRDIDHRSDLYSLGVTFYEMLTGRLPFNSPDPLEVIHSHIAQAPAPPSERNPGIPSVLSNLVLQLLAKTPESRYQSASGLRADLARCAEEWRASGMISDFPLGRDDAPDRFVVPQHLYGRESEGAALREAFERVAAGATELVLVGGYSGIGKTSLIRELYRSLPRHRGRVVAGKFDQLARDVPYDALAQAFRSLIRQILTESETEVGAWKERLLAALGGNGRVVADLIPELALVLGAMPEVSPLDPAEHQIRFNETLRSFIAAFASPGMPLVLFLDDLQWADAATLSLLPLLLTGGEGGGLLVLGAYRDNEVTPAHPLRRAVEDLRARDATVSEITLAPLGDEDLARFIADTLRDTPDRVRGVASLVAAKTGGNPFFVTQFLRTLHHDGYIAWDAPSSAWRADLAAIERANITDNVVDLMGAKIHRLRPRAQRALHLAACVGSRFDLETLATISEQSVAESAADLWEAAEQGLVLPVEKSYGFAPDLSAGAAPAQIVYRFLHDRVQQAAYAQIPEEARRSVHVGVGRRLLERADLDDPVVVFEVVNHLNFGRGLVTDRDERIRLAELNLAAGRKAKASGAYPSASTYFSAGADAIGDEAWGNRHALAFALHLERAETDYLCGRFEEAERRFTSLLERAASPLERTEVTVRLIVQYETMSRYPAAIRAGLEGLRAIGVDLPESDADQTAAFHRELEAVRGLMAGRSVESLLALPPLTDDTVRQAMRLLMAIWAPSYISGRTALRSLASARMVRLSLEHGHCEESAFGYLHHAIAIGYSLDEHERAFEFGTLALALNERLDDVRLRAAIHHRFAALVNPWSRPFESCLIHAREAVRSGLEAGQLQVAAYAEFQQSWYGMMLERDLDAYRSRYEPVIGVLTRLKSPAFLAAQRLILQWAHALQGGTEAPTRLASDTFDEDEFAATYGKGGIFKGLHATLRLELLDTFEKVEEARHLAAESEAAAELFASAIWPALFAFRHALSLCAWLPSAPEDERGPALSKLDSIEARFRRWSASAPENFEPMHLLVRAEIARVRGAAGEAIEGYEAAIASAERRPSPRHRALANELYGRFWLGRGQPRVASVFLAEARFGYAQWGATAKVADLDARHGSLFARAETPPRAPESAGVLVTTATTGVSLDALALARAAQAISREIVLDRLLERLMRVALESAGAERGTIVLEQEGGPAIFVEGTAGEIRVHAGRGVPLDGTGLVVGLVHFVRRTGESVVLDDALADESRRDDPYVVRERPRSVLATPILNQGKTTGVLYMENRLAPNAFTPDRLQVTQILSAQAAIAIENARLFEEVSRLRDRLQAENVYLQTEIKTTHGFTEIIGETPALRKVLAQIEQVAPTQSTVLITGETGTGKELVARAIHRTSPRADRALIAVNCGAISPGLVESELFGHEKGAFTGALSRKIGRFELADGGTIFLDEIGDLPLDLQTKLLRVLQEGEIDRVGGTRPIKVNVRVIAATHRDLEREVAAGAFRQDLFYRLNVFPIRLPSLRERREDIPLLVRHFVVSYGAKMGRRIAKVPKDTMTALSSYHWPGNVRELANVVERSVIISEGETLRLADWIASSASGDPESSKAALEEVERQHILKVLIQMGWRVSGPQGAAKVLGLRPTTLEARMKRLGIARP
ncbi:MAG TPA: sigma 54-interacting transcriptional regulator [Candidatus Eisenbacteria bacterium]|nr:sigma 54-interacting transcriptional regulator [Candidatus Eisenbacteria bacterium]